MGIGSFGGRPSGGNSGSTGGSSSGGGTVVAGKDIGESILVPITFKHADYLDTGSEVSAASYPDMYARLASGGKPIYYSEIGDIGSTVGQARSTTRQASVCIEHGSEILVIHQGGVVTASSDLLNFSYRGVVGNIYGLTPDVFWGSGFVYAGVSNGTNAIAVSNARGFPAMWITTDSGVTWEVLDSPVLSAALAAGNPNMMLPMSRTSQYMCYVNRTTKKFVRSLTGFTWEEIDFPTYTGSPYTMVADPNSGLVCIQLNTENVFLYSSDHGTTWAKSSAITPTGSWTGKMIMFGSELYATSYSNPNQHFYKSTDGGANWALAGTASSVGAASMSNVGVVGGKIVAIGGNVFAVNGKHLTSTNGSTWVLNTSPSQTNTRAAVFALGQIIFFNNHSAAGLEKPTLSNNGTSITATSTTSDLVMPLSVNGSCVIVTPTRMFAFGNQSSSMFAYTDDGENWTTGNMPVASVWVGGCYDPATGKIYVTSSTLNEYYESSDNGATWTAVTVTVASCSAANTFPVVIGDVVAFPHSTATARFILMLSKPSASGVRTQLRSGASVGNVAGTPATRIIAFRDGVVMPSSTTNNITQVQDIVKSTAGVNKALTIATTAGVYGANRSVCFVANGANCSYSTVNDLSSWTNITLKLNQNWTQTIAINDDQFLLIASGSSKALLGDGLSWEIVELNGIPFDDYSNAVMFKGQVYLFSNDKSTKGVKAVPSSKRYIPQAISPIDGMKYVVKAR